MIIKVGVKHHLDFVIISTPIMDFNMYQKKCKNEEEIKEEQNLI